MDWKAKSPDQVCLYFQCTSKLIANFRVVFKNDLIFEGNRAIVLPLDKELPLDQLKPCILTALRYHLVKNKPLLGL